MAVTVRVPPLFEFVWELLSTAKLVLCGSWGKLKTLNKQPAGGGNHSDPPEPVFMNPYLFVRGTRALPLLSPP